MTPTCTILSDNTLCSITHRCTVIILFQKLGCFIKSNSGDVFDYTSTLIILLQKNRTIGAKTVETFKLHIRSSG